MGANALLEREPELALIADAARRVTAGAGTVLLIEGEPGIGKTALMEAAATSASTAGIEVFTARGRALEREFGFGVVRQLFERVLATRSSDAVFSGRARFAAPVLGIDLDEPGPGVPAAETVLPAIHGLYWMTLSLAEPGPLALLVDDAHWADGASIRFLAYLAPRIADAPVLLVVSARPGEEADRLRHVLGEAELLEPGRLSEAATAAVVRGLAPDADDHACRSCFVATGGNAFYVREVAAAIRDWDAAKGTTAFDAWSPESVTRAVAGRIAALAPGAREVARACAVLGDGAPLHSVATIAALSDDSARQAIDSLRAGGIFAPSAPIEFAHPIVRTAVELSMPPGLLASAHASAARLEAAGGAAAERVALHLLASDPGEDPWVCERLAEAASEALGRGAPEAAASYLERALAEPAPMADRPQLLLELGTATAYALRPGAAAHVRRGFELASSADERLEAALLHGHLSMQAGRGADALEPLFQVLDESPADSSRALLVEGFAANLTRAQLSGRLAARPIIDRIRGRREIGVEAEPPVLIAIAAELAMEGVDAERAVELASSALDRLDAVPPLARAFAGLTAVRVLSVADEHERAAAAIDSAIDAARSRGALFDFIYYAVSKANLELRAGRVFDGEAEARSAFEIARGERWPLGIASIASYLVHALVERGETDEARELLREARLDRPAAELTDVYTSNGLLLARASLHLASDEPHEALADLIELGARQDAFGEPNPAVSPWRSTMALALDELGEHERARELAESELDLARRWGAPRAIGVALHATGRIATGAERVALLTKAAEMLSSSYAQLEHGRALADLGAAALESGESDASKAHLRRALELAHICGAAALEERVLVTLRAAGARPRRPVLRGPGALTPSEQRVAAMAAAGLTNREIAERRFVTVRTVEYHLQGAYRKLGINARTDLSAALADDAPKKTGSPTQKVR
jgi:DNA-binding NarL/FixJ family response regulator